MSKELETPKQLEYIRFIEMETGVPYTGANKEDASKYIDENKNKLDPSATMNAWAITQGY